MTARRALVEPNDPLSMRWQCELLGVNRSSLYYEPVEPDAEQLGLMRRMDELHLEHPFFGSRMMTQTLKAEGALVNRKRVQRLMRLMGLESTAPKPNTSKPAPEHAVYPYLLRNLTVSRVNQVWAADITYIPMARGFVYLVAIIDWYSRRVLAWRLSNTLETSFCVEALHESLDRYGCPEIFNTDQGSQFTSEDFTDVLLERGIKISMDGKGRFNDNIFVERLWRSLKYEEVYLYAYDTVQVARAGIARYIDFFNGERPHKALGFKRPRASTICSARSLKVMATVITTMPKSCRFDHRLTFRRLPLGAFGKQDQDYDDVLNPARLHLSKAPFGSEEWGPPHGYSRYCEQCTVSGRSC